nr:GTP cyclohydrolase I FolE [Bacilli bacterium]
MDMQKIEKAVKMILEAVGEDPNREGLLDTPKRVAKMYKEIFQGLHEDPNDVLSAKFEVGESEIVIVKDIPFYSMCEHHLLPFYGVAHVAYIPQDGIVTGLSKLARLVDMTAKRPQVQERLTNQVADSLYEGVNAAGVLVTMEAAHMCMSMRGIKKPGSMTTTMATRGTLATDLAQRSYVMQLMKNQG